MALAAVAHGAGNVARSFVPSTSTLYLAKRSRVRGIVMEIVAQQKKDSLKRPTAVAVIIVIVRRDGDKAEPTRRHAPKKLKSRGP